MGFFVFRLRPDALRWKIRHAPCSLLCAFLAVMTHASVLGFTIRDGLSCFSGMVSNDSSLALTLTRARFHWGTSEQLKGEGGMQAT